MHLYNHQSETVLWVCCIDHWSVWYQLISSVNRSRGQDPKDHQLFIGSDWRWSWVWLQRPLWTKLFLCHLFNSVFLNLWVVTPRVDAWNVLFLIKMTELGFIVCKMITPHSLKELFLYFHFLYFKSSFRSKQRKKTLWAEAFLLFSLTSRSCDWTVSLQPARKLKLTQRFFQIFELKERFVLFSSDKHEDQVWSQWCSQGGVGGAVDEKHTLKFPFWR